MSGLQKQTAAVPLRGLDTHSDPKSAPLGTLDLVENMYFKRLAAGGAELRKCQGTTALTRVIFDGGSISVGRKASTFNDERLLLSDVGLYSYSPQTINWHYKGALTPAAITAEFVADSVHARSSPDSAISGNLLCYVDQDDQPLPLVTIIDLNTGLKVLKDSYLGISTRDGVRVVALATCFMIVASNAGTFTAVKIAYATPTTISAPTVIATNGSAATPRWHATRNGTADQMLLAYNGDAANRLRAILWNSAMTSAGSFLSGEQPDGAIVWLHHDYLDGNGYIAYVDSTRGLKVLTVVISGFSAGSAAVLDAARATGRNITGMRTGGANHVFVEVAGAAAYLNKIVRSTGGACANWQLGAGLATTVFKVSSSYYLTSAFADGEQDKYFVLDANSATPAIVATALDGLGHGLSMLAGFIGTVPAISATVVAIPVTRFETTILTGTDVYSAVYLRLDFAPSVSSPKRLGENLHFPGGIPRVYDGAAVCEQGFPVFPTLFNSAQSGGGSLTLLARYTFRVVYLWLDARGQQHRSAPSLPLTVTLTGANNKITFDITMLRLGDKPRIANGTSNLFVEVYATEANGAPLFRQTTGYNDPTADSIAGGHATETDATTLQLYTNEGEKPHIAPPPARLVESIGPRMFLAGTDVPNTVWPSSEFLNGEAPWFSSDSAFTVESAGGDLTAISELDGHPVLFKRGSIYAVFGQGPAANGDGGYDVQKVCNTVGAISQAGVIRTRDGVMFKSTKGIYLLPIGGGQPVKLYGVEAYDSLTITGAALVDDLEQVRFTTAEGRTLYYHTGIKDENGVGLWTTRTGQAAVDATSWNGKWAWLSSAGVVSEEIAGQYADDGAAIATAVKWTWINPGGLLGNLRIYTVALQGEVQANCTVTGTIAYDYDPTPPAAADTKTIALTTATKGVLKMAGSRGRMSALQISISESGTTEGYRLTGLGIEFGAKPGYAKSAATAFLA